MFGRTRAGTWPSRPHAPEAAADLAEVLALSGRLETLDTPNLMKIVSAPDGQVSDRFVGLYPALEALAPQQSMVSISVVQHATPPSTPQNGRTNAVNLSRYIPGLSTLREVLALVTPENQGLGEDQMKTKVLEQ
jgi:hypothetical protein